MLVVRPLSDGSFQELAPIDVQTGTGTSAITIPWPNFAVWMASGIRQAHGLYIVSTPQAPAGKRRTSYSLTWNGDKTAVDYVPVYEDEPKEVPQTISRRQVMLALLQLGKLDIVLAIIPTLDLAARISWNEASYFNRDDALLVRLAASQNWTPAELDTVFVLGSTL